MIILFFGPPASGKSTLINKLTKNLKNYKVLTSDEFKGKTYKKLFNAIKQNLDKYNYLIINGTFFRKDLRNQFRGITKRKRKLIIYVPCSKETALIRNKKRKNKIPEKAIHIMYSKFEKPSKKEFNIELNTEKLNKKQAIESFKSKL